jgi:DNA polymerase
VAVCAHHAQFDGIVLSERYGVRPAFWFCTLSMGRVLHSRASLADLAQAYGVGEKGHELASVQGLRREDMTQRQWLAFGEYCKNDVRLMAQLRQRMQPHFPGAELRLIDMTVRWFTEPVLRADLEVLRKALDEERARKAVFLERLAADLEVPHPPGSLVVEANELKRALPVGDPIERVRASLSSSDKFADLLRAAGVEPPVKLNPKGEEIYAFAKSDPGMVDLLEHRRDDVRFLAEARLAVKSTLVETRTERLLGVAQRGAVPFYLKYGGAHTHRWSGGDKMNPQNFNRGGALRDAILAPEGHVLVVADSGQIEARVVAWLAGEAGLLEAFRRNDRQTDEYQAAFAARVEALGKEQVKEIERELAALGLREGDFYSDVGGGFFGKKLSKKETPLERQIAKAMILGLGFGMGWLKFALELLKGLLGADPVQFTRLEAAKFGVDVDAFARRAARTADDRETTCAATVRGATSRLRPEDLLVHCAVADYFVRRYRAANPRVVRLWRACEDVIKAMDLGQPLRFRGLTVERHAIRKPGGLVLRYPGLRREKRGWGYLGGASGRERAKLYGGLLTENLVQSLARDVVAEQALAIQSDGIRIVTTTHDEVVAAVPEADGPEALKLMLRAMRRPPTWAADLPLNAAGGFGLRYGDAK